MKIEEIIPLLRHGGFCTIGLTTRKYSLRDLEELHVFHLFGRDDFAYFPLLKEKPKSEIYPNMDIGFLHTVWKCYVDVQKYSFHQFSNEFKFNPEEVIDFTENRKSYE